MGGRSCITPGLISDSEGPDCQNGIPITDTIDSSLDPALSFNNESPVTFPQTNKRRHSRDYEDMEDANIVLESSQKKTKQGKVKGMNIADAMVKVEEMRGERLDKEFKERQRVS